MPWNCTGWGLTGCGEKLCCKGPGPMEGSKPNMSQQCVLATKNANSRANLSRKVIICLYLMLFRQQLEYCIQFWASHYKRDIDRVGQVQPGGHQDGWAWSIWPVRRWLSSSQEVFSTGVDTALSTLIRACVEQEVGLRHPEVHLCLNCSIILLSFP